MRHFEQNVPICCPCLASFAFRHPAAHELWIRLGPKPLGPKSTRSRPHLGQPCGQPSARVECVDWDSSRRPEWANEGWFTPVWMSANCAPSWATCDSLTPTACEYAFWSQFSLVYYETVYLSGAVLSIQSQLIRTLQKLFYTYLHFAFAWSRVTLRKSHSTSKSTVCVWHSPFLGWYELWSSRHYFLSWLQKR